MRDCVAVLKQGCNKKGESMPPYLSPCWVLKRLLLFCVQSISVAFEHCILCGYSRKPCSANMTLTQSVCMAFKHFCVICVNLHPQKFLATLGRHGRPRIQYVICNVQTQRKSTVWPCGGCVPTSDRRTLMPFSTSWPCHCSL